MRQVAAISSVEIVVEGILNGNSWIGSINRGVDLNNGTSVVKALLIGNITEPLDANSQIIL